MPFGYQWDADFEHAEAIIERGGVDKPRPKSIHVYSDSDYVGCRKTRKSTTGIAIMIGKHCLATRCKNLSVIGLSSGEAELYAAVLACSMGIWIRQMYEDLGVEM